MGWVYCNLLEFGLMTVSEIPKMWLEYAKEEAKKRGIYNKYFGERRNCSKAR